MIDHLSTYATDYAATRAFYEAVLPPLGYALEFDMPEHNMCAFGPPGRPVFWVIAAQVAAMLEEDFANSRKMNPGEFGEKPWWFRLGARVARLTSPIL